MCVGGVGGGHVRTQGEGGDGVSEQAMPALYKWHNFGGLINCSIYL